MHRPVARFALAAPLALLLTAAAPAATTPEPPATRADGAFAQLSALAGTWRPADRPESPLRIRFYPTAGGTVLVEEWTRAGQPHSLTLYHRDGAALIATHYCPQGNQPRMALAGRDANGLHFAFRDATDLDPDSEGWQHDLWFDLADPASPVRSEIYHDEGQPQPRQTLRLTRAE